MRLIFFPILILIFIHPAVESWAENTERAPLVLGKGEQRWLRIPGLKRYSLGSGAIRVIPAPSSKGQKGADSEALLLKAVRPGHSDLWVWKADGSSEHRSVRVEATAAVDLPAPLARALGSLDETEVLIAGSGVVLRGEIQTIAELARLHALALGFPKEVHDETEPSDQLVAQAVQRIQSWISGSSYRSQLILENTGRRIFVRGSFERPEQATAATKTLRALYPAAVLDLDSMPDTAPTVHFRVFLLELKKSRFHHLGLSWPALQEGAFKVTSAGITNALALDVALNALEGDGAARVLSNPELVVRAPGEAELFAGGELPIRTHNQFNSQVSWKNYGLALKLKVSHSSGQRVRLEIFTEVSHLDPSIAQHDIPGLQANRMKTQVDARYGTPLLLSGLLQQGTREHARGLPFLRQIPILGLLFGSEDYLNERSELVAILLPSASPPHAPLERVSRWLPRGPMPPPREWISPERERALRESTEWPWNALK